MTALDILLAIAGFSVTALVVAGMILITPRGGRTVHAEGADQQASELSATRGPRQHPVPSPDGRVERHLTRP